MTGAKPFACCRQGTKSGLERNNVMKQFNDTSNLKHTCLRSIISGIICSLKFLDMATAFRVYVNGDLLVSNGIPGETATVI